MSDLRVDRVSITLGGKKLGTVKVIDGKVSVTRVVPKNLSGKAVLRVRDREGEVLVRATIRVVRTKGAYRTRPPREPSHQQGPALVRARAPPHGTQGPPVNRIC